MNKIVAMVKTNSQNHLTVQGIKTIRDLQQHLQRIFEESEHQNSVMAKLYQLLFPDWKKIQRI